MQGLLAHVVRAGHRGGAPRREEGGKTDTTEARLVYVGYRAQAPLVWSIWLADQKAHRAPAPWLPRYGGDIIRPPARFR